MSDTICPDCGMEMEQIEKTTFTGREMREYQCPKCKGTQIVDCGEALWKVLSDVKIRRRIKDLALPGMIYTNSKTAAKGVSFLRLPPQDRL